MAGIPEPQIRSVERSHRERLQGVPIPDSATSTLEMMSARGPMLIANEEGSVPMLY